MTGLMYKIQAGSVWRRSGDVHSFPPGAESTSDQITQRFCSHCIWASRLKPTVIIVLPCSVVRFKFPFWFSGNFFIFQVFVVKWRCNYFGADYTVYSGYTWILKQPLHRKVAPMLCFTHSVMASEPFMWFIHVIYIYIFFYIC